MSQCKHVFDRECIKQYLEVKQMRGHKPECPVCHIEISIDLEAEALDLEENTKKARQGILSRLNLDVSSIEEYRTCLAGPLLTVL